MFNLTQNSMSISLTSKENPASLFALGLPAYEWPQAVRDELKELRCIGLGHFVKPNEWHTHCNCIDVRKGSETPTGLFAVHYNGDKWPVFASEQPAAFSRTDKLYYFVLTASQWLAVSTTGRQQAFEWGKR